MPELLDQFGTAIPPALIAQMREETAPTNAALGRPAFSGHLAFGIDPGTLGAIVRSADNGSTLDYFVLAEEIEELYPHYAAVLAKRRRQVTQLPVKVEAADTPDGEKHADFVRDWLDTEVLADAMFDITDAIGKGYSAHEIVWETKPGRIRPAELIYRTQRFFEISWEDGATLWLRTGAGYSALSPHKFLVHKHRSKSGLVVRSGLTRVVAFMWMFHAFTLKDWALFVQAYGFPIRVGRYGPAATPADRSVLLRAVSSIAGDVAAIIPNSMEIEFAKDTQRNDGSQLYEKRADWLNREVSKVVLGGTAGTDAINGGHAVGREHRSAEQDVEKFDARLLAVSITRQIVKDMISFTFGPQDAYPKLVIGSEEKAPLNDVIAAVGALGSLGLTAKADELRDRLDLTKPEPNDEVIGGKPPVAAELPTKLPPQPPVPEAQAAGAGGLMLAPLRELVLMHEAPPDVVEAMIERLSADASGALAGMTDAVRRQFDEATDMKDLAHRLAGLQLPTAEYAEAMARGMALSQLVGQASLVAELGRHGR